MNKERIIERVTANQRRHQENQLERLHESKEQQGLLTFEKLSI
jgi:hypothetical protein